jgi:hypothetical protein
MAKSEDGTEKSERGAGGAQKDVSLAPACLVVAVIAAVALSLAMIGMAALLTNNQGKRAAYSVREQVIPWVEQSSLSTSDKQNIIERLTSLSSDMEREQLSSRQLSRMVLRMSDSPILQWGLVEQLVVLANKAESFTAEEKADFSSACDRWLFAASEGKLALQDMEFAVQNVATKDRRSGRLSIRDDVNDERLREFKRRMSTITEKLEVSNEPFHKSVSQVFLGVIDDAMKEAK